MYWICNLFINILSFIFFLYSFIIEYSLFLRDLLIIDWWVKYIIDVEKMIIVIMNFVVRKNIKKVWNFFFELGNVELNVVLENSDFNISIVILMIKRKVGIVFVL